MLGAVHVERDASHAHTDVIQWDFFIHAHACSSQSKQVTDLGQTLEERQSFLCLQEMDIKVREVILSEELKCGLHPSDGWNLLAELDEAHACMNEIDGECAGEGERLSRQVMRISGILVDLGMLPIQDIPQLPRSAREVLSVVDLILKSLQEALTFSADP
jgi:hypothetical protein